MMGVSTVGLFYLFSGILRLNLFQGSYSTTPLMGSGRSIIPSCPVIHAFTGVSTLGLMDGVSSMEISMVHNPPPLSTSPKSPPPLHQSQRLPLLPMPPLRPTLRLALLRIPQLRPNLRLTLLQRPPLRLTLLVHGGNVVARTGLDLLHVSQGGPVCSIVRSTLSARPSKRVTSPPA